MRPSIITIIIASGMLALVVMQVHATDTAQSSDSDIRVQYDNDNAPQFVIFRTFLSGLSQSRKDKDQSRNIFLSPGMTLTSNPNELFDYFMMLYEQIESEVSESIKRMLCPDDRPRPTGAAIFSVFDALDDLRFAVDHKFLAIAKAEVATNAIFDVDRALENIPSSFGVVAMYHQKQYSGSETRANEVATEMCAKFDNAEQPK